MSPSFAPAHLFSFIVATLVAAGAHATIKINGVDESRVSNVTGLNTANVVIWGGVAGDCTVYAADHTCSSCTVVSSGGDTTRLTPCNDRRINGTLVMRITVTSDTQASGYPAITFGGTTSGSGSTNAPLNTLSGTVSKGNPGTIELRWSQICPLLVTTSSSGSGGGSAPNTDCTLPTGADSAQAFFNVGLKSVNDGGGFASGDDYAQITIKVVAGPSQTADYLTSVNGNGITYFEMTSGDAKGWVSKLSCSTSSSFPAGQNVTFRWVRVLFEPRTSPNTSVWSSISRGSPHTDLEISSSGNCSSGLNISPNYVQGGLRVISSTQTENVTIENDQVYDIKLAVVDDARNAYLYTPDGESGAAVSDTDCETSDGQPNQDAIGGSGKYECHTIRPAEVTGVLANKANCFIATASYGSPMAGEVDTFRHFRDTYLIPTKLGFKFVRWYYEHGPVYAKFIAQSDTYRAIARGALWLPLQFAKLSLDYGLAVGLSFLASITLAPFALLAWALNRKRKARVHA